MNGTCDSYREKWTLEIRADPPCWRSLQVYSFWIRGYSLRFIASVIYSLMPVRQIIKPPIFKKNITLNFGEGCKETAVISFISLQWAWEQGFFLIQTNIVWFMTNRRKTHVRTPRAKESFFFFLRQLSLLLNNASPYRLKFWPNFPGK